MKIAVISDIHGNDEALKVVLEEAKRDSVCRIFVLGDIVGYYYHPDKVIKLLDCWQKDIVGGNHEQMLKDIQEKKISLEEITNKFGSGIKHAFAKLTTKRINELVNLPLIKQVDFDKVKFLLCHATPWNHEYYIYPDMKEGSLDKFSKYQADFIFLGHTHYPYIYQKNKQMIVNVGSVGQSREIGGLASWTIIDTANRVLKLKATPYDTEDLIEEVKKNDPQLPYLYQVLTRNRFDSP